MKARKPELRRVLVTWLATARGGAEQSSYDLCAELARRYSLDVTLLLWQYDTNFSVKKPADFRVILCHESVAYRQALTDWLMPAPAGSVLFTNHRTFLLDQALAELNAVPCGVIFRESPLQHEALRTLESAGKPVLVYRRGAELDWNSLRRAAALIGVSNFCVRQLHAFAAAHPTLIRIYNGLNDEFFPALRETHPKHHFLIVSRLIGWKAIDFAIQTFARLWTVYPNARLEVAGTGEEETRLRHLAASLLPAEAVSFLGFQENIARVYQQNAFLFHPSPIESFGRVIAEAGACGLPAVVPQSAGAGELILNGHTGLTFQAGDTDDCLRALQQACQLSADEYQRLAHNARQRAQALFNLQRAVEEYAGLANAMLQEHANGNPNKT